MSEPRKHVQKECTDSSCGGMCNACCLGWCKVCGGAEGDLTTDCPGEHPSKEQSEAVDEGRLDYTSERGWFPLQPGESAHPKFVGDKP